MPRIIVAMVLITATMQLGGCTGTLHLGTQISGFTTR